MATRKTRGSTRRQIVLKRAAQRRGKKLGTSATRQRQVRARVREALDRSVKKRVVKIRYDHLRNGRVRYQPIDAKPGKGLSPSYASRQGARRAARKQFKGSRVVAVVAA